MGILHKNERLPSPTFEQLGQFVRQRRQQWTGQGLIFGPQLFFDIVPKDDAVFFK